MIYEQHLLDIGIEEDLARRMAAQTTCTFTYSTASMCIETFAEWSKTKEGGYFWVKAYDKYLEAEKNTRMTKND